jgi:penicillin amidase
LRASLPRYDGEVASHGIAQSVSVERDALGTATIRASTRTDAAWTLGYVHAQERYFEMDLFRRSAAGELAELFGSAAVPIDRRARAHRMRARMQHAYDTLPPAQHALADAYRDGVNAGLGDLSARPFEYLLLRTKPAPWRGEDALLVEAAMAFTLNDAENARELAFSRVHAALPASAYRFLVAHGGEWDAPLFGADLAWPTPPSAAELDLHAPSAAPSNDGDAKRDDTPGSNGFAVDGSLTGGGALVANDMHLDLRVPNLWFRTRLVYADPDDASRTIDVTGASLPGAPAIVVGSNGEIAWGFTNSYIDTTDWVRVQRDPSDATRYRADGRWEPIATFDETIKVAGKPDEHLSVEETRWGPILAKDVDGTPLALAWTAQQPGGLDLGIGRMELARSLDDAVAIARSSGMPPQNLVAGDRAGRIAWTIAGRIPKRVGGFDPALPADWSQEGTGWNGWLDANDYPGLADPADHRIWTANQRIVDAAMLDVIGDAGYDIGARAKQIRDGLLARERFAPADLLAVQLDDRALFLERWKKLLATTLDHAPASPLHDAMKHALADWNGRASVDSVSYRLVRAWRNEVVDGVLGAFWSAVRAKFPDFTPPKLAQSEYVAWTLLRDRPEHLAPHDARDWDAFLLAAVDRVGAKLDAQPGGITARTWGERNTAHIAHPISRVACVRRTLARHALRTAARRQQHAARAVAGFRRIRTFRGDARG